MGCWDCFKPVAQVGTVVVTLGIGWAIPWLLFRDNKEDDELAFMNERVTWVFVALFTFAAGAVAYSFCCGNITTPLLKKANAGLFVLHLASGVSLAWLASTKNTWTAYVTFGRSQWGKFDATNATNGTATTAAPGFSPDGCSEGGCFVRTEPCLLAEANIEYMVLAFHLLSTLQHLAVYLDWKQHYTVNIEDGNHWMRWFEYSFSASIMFASWAFLCGITDVIALVPLCVCVGTTQIFGYFSDAAARMTWPETQTQLDNGSEDTGLLLEKRKVQVRERTTALQRFISNRPLQVKIVGVVYVTYAAVLAWPLAVQNDIALLVDVTSVILALHFVFGFFGILFAWRSKDKTAKQKWETIYPVFREGSEINQDDINWRSEWWVILYIVYDLAQLGALVYLRRTRDTIIQDQHNRARHIAYLALGGVALCMLKVAPYARNTQTTKTTLEANQQSGANRFIGPIWIFTLAWVPYLLGAWFMTVAVFHDSLQHPGPNAEDPPDALYVIIVTQFLFFSCFAGAQIWYLWNPGQQRYLDTEFYFCLLSLVSKTALAWSLYSGAAGRKELGLRAPGASNTEIPGLSLPWC